jgi:hypothetical protein
VTGHIRVNNLGRFMRFENEHLIGQDFSGETVAAFRVRGSRFESCDFSGIRAKEVSFSLGDSHSEYVDCVFDRARIGGAFAGDALFERCSFRNVSIKGWIATMTELVDCTFSGEIKESILFGAGSPHENAAAGRDRNRFTGNDFTETRLSGVAFKGGIDLGLQRLPRGPEYVYVAHGEQAVEAASIEVQSWDAKIRADAEFFLKLQRDILRTGQRQLFYEVDHRPGFRDAQAAVTEIMRSVDARLSASDPH